MNRLIWVIFTTLSMSGAVAADEDSDLTSAEKLTAAASENRMRLDFEDGEFSGPAWDRLVAEGQAAQFFLIGEEHGIAENPQLAGQLFAKLSNHGYSKLAIEISPTMAWLVDRALARGGLDGLRELFAEPGGEPAFFGMREEAEMLATVRAAVASDEPVFWGTDYEVAGDRQLLKLLAGADKPATAEEPLEALVAASTAAWEEYAATGSPQHIFSFGGDPALVRAVRDAWPAPGARSDIILNTLEKTLAANNLWLQGKAWESNASRAALQRENFLRYWRSARETGETPKVMAKFGASHIVRGLSQTAVYDLGTLLPEIAALEGGRSFSVMVLPGAGSMIAGLNPSTWTYESRPAEGGYLEGLKLLTRTAFDDDFTLIDLVPLRSVIGMNRGDLDEELFRIVHGYDMLLVMSGSTPSGELEHDSPR